jgi:hypothetical protein
MNTGYFPSEISGFGANRLQFDQLAKQLSAFHEGPLHLTASPPERVYRFTWIRAFHPSIVVSVAFGPHLPAVITVKRAERDGILPAYFRINCRSWELPDREVEALALTFKQAAFRSLPPVLPSRGISFDGADWLVEAKEPGFYHLAYRHSPDADGVYGIGREFLRIADLENEKVY